MDKNLKTQNTLSVNRVNSRYIIQFENVFDALDVYERSVYEALRFYTDYSKNSSIVEMTIDELMIKSKIKRRKIFYILNKLENVHFLIKRTNWENGTFGYTNHYEVAMHLDHFKSLDVCKNESAHNISESINDHIEEGVHTVHSVVHTVHSGSPNAQEKKKIKQDIQKQHAFEIFWALYPIKKNKKRAMQIWRAHNLDKISEEIITKLHVQIAQDHNWLSGYAPHPATYLHGDRWNDAIAQSPQNAQRNASISIGKAPLVVYSNFVADLKSMIMHKEIPANTEIPNFEDWKTKSITSDSKMYIRGLGLNT